MFERTFSFWRRWVGSADHETAGSATATLDAPAGDDDRRLWRRHATDLTANLHFVDGTPVGSTAAVVRDISRGGAMVFVDQEIAPGQLVNVDLPRGDSTHPMTVLACVVRSQRESHGPWALGCVFSRELTDDDLAHLGASRVRHDLDDQRTWKRFDTQLQAKFQRIGGDQNAEARTAQVLNLSASGVGLLTNVAIDAGALLNIDLVGKDGRVARTILACVVHVSPRGDSSFALGCNFIRELSDEDFQALV